MKEHEIAGLIFKKLEGSLSGEEELQLSDWLAANPVNRELFHELNDEEKLSAAIAEFHANNYSNIKNRIWKTIITHTTVTEVAPVIPMRRRYLFRIAAAASILFVIGLGSYFIFFNDKKPGTQASIPETPIDVKAPVTNRAMITLADGKAVYLDSAVNGELVQQGSMKIVKLANGQIAYQAANGDIVKEVLYNTLSNPRGSKVIDMKMADGSHVWLNAGSSVTYPIAFTGNERKVSITGEAYFEIAHDKTKPFIVSKGDMNVQVLGTKFNVNAYDDEADIKVTLLEGLIKVSLKERSVTIKPGQQTRITATNNLETSGSIDLEEVMAWKNGLFLFSKASIEEVMRQISRWYDVDIIYESKPTEHFRGEITREVEVSKVLKMLETTEAVHFRIEGGRVYVTR